MSEPLNLKTEHPQISLSQFVLDDAAALGKLIQLNSEPLAESGSPTALNLSSKSAINEHISNTENLRMGIILGGKALIGEIGLRRQQNGAEIGCWVDKDHWHRGYATVAVRALSEYGINVAKFTRINAYVADDNIGSARVLEKVGYEEKGTFDKVVHFVYPPTDPNSAL